MKYIVRVRSESTILDEASRLQPTQHITASFFTYISIKTTHSVRQPSLLIKTIATPFSLYE